jgi:hypothetical protein
MIGAQLLGIDPSGNLQAGVSFCKEKEKPENSSKEGRERDC